MSDLCQLTTLKSRMRIQESDVVDDDFLIALIAAVSGRFVKECNRLFARAASATYEFRADERDIIVDRFPVESVASFHLKESEAGGWVEQTGIDYLIGPKKNIIELVVALGTARELARVTFAGGYVLPGTTPGGGQTALPAEIENAALDQCAYLYQNRDRLGLASVSSQGGSLAKDPQSVVTPLSLLPHVLAVCRKHERWRN